jgi:hypothetical protein
MDYVVMLQRAWQILTRHKILWLFGLIAVLAGQDALFNLHGGRSVQPIAEAIVNLPPTAANLARAVVPVGSEIVLIGVMIVVGVALILIGMLAHAALIGLTQSAERGNEITFKAGLRAGWQHIDRLIIIRLIFNIPFVILALLGLTLMQRLIDPAAGPLTFSQSLLVLDDAGLLSIFLIVSLICGVFVGAIGIGADRAVVIDGMEVVAALRQGWQTLRDHIGQYVAISGILVSTIVLSTLVLACPAMILFANQFDSLTANAGLSTDVSAALLNQPSGIVLIVIGVLIYAAATTFASIMWTIAYRRYAR